MKKCPYCDFYSLEKATPDIMAQYISMLLKELSLYRDALKNIKTLYIGGGTPSVLPPEEIEILLSGIFKQVKYSDIKESTFEVNPGTLEKEKLKILKEGKMTRISLGVQSFNERDLINLGRFHSVGDNLKAIDRIKNLSFDLSIDLIYGIPNQTLKDWLNNISQIEKIKPDHISVYELTVEKGTALEKEIISGLLEKPPEEEIIKIFEFTHDYLEDRGYYHYEVSNYAIPGKECLHNINYWRRGEYIGIGAGAHSFFNKKRIENFDDIERYIESVKKGLLPYKKIINLTPQDEITEFIMLGLRKREGISLDDLPTEISSIREEVLKKAYILIEEGLLERKNNHLRPTVKGFLLLNEIIERLIEY